MSWVEGKDCSYAIHVNDLRFARISDGLRLGFSNGSGLHERGDGRQS